MKLKAARLARIVSLEVPLALAVLAGAAAAQTGSWGTPGNLDISVGPGFIHAPQVGSNWQRFNAVHMALIPQPADNAGLVVAWDRQDQTGSSGGWFQRWTVLDPSTDPPTTLWNDELAIPGPSAGDLFCAGLAWTPDGRLFVAGGTDFYTHGTGTTYGGAKLAFLYDPRPAPGAPYGSWTQLPSMTKDRWYPTVINAGNGTMIVLGGSDHGASESSYEVYDLASSSWQVNPASGDTSFGGPTGLGKFFSYPRTHVLEDGQLFVSGPHPQAELLDHAASPGVWVDLDVSSVARHDGASLLFPLPFGLPDVVLILGGALDDTTHMGAQASTDWCLPGSGPARWQVGPSMNRERVHLNAVVLPDARVVAIGGNAMVAGVHTDWKDAELLDADLTWKLMATGDSVRDYHSTALLLPDGKILSAGGDKRDWDWQLLSPPYFDDALLPRPTSVRLSTTDLVYWQGAQATYTATFELPEGASIAKVVLMAAGATTHHSDMAQRYVELPILDQSSGSVTFAPPFGPPQKAAPLHFTAPRGYYQLFLISDQGVPSEGTFVQL